MASVILVPEAATLLFAGGFPRVRDSPGTEGGSTARQRKITQRTLYAVQRGLEDVTAAAHSDRVLLCDRGTPDGAAYWPAKDPEDFFDAMGTTLQDELHRYDGVIFFDSAACAQAQINAATAFEGGNPVRTESMEEAVHLNNRLKAIWRQHPRFREVTAGSSFLDKIHRGILASQALLQDVAASELSKRRKKDPSAASEAVLLATDDAATCVTCGLDRDDGRDGGDGDDNVTSNNVDAPHAK